VYTASKVIQVYRCTGQVHGYIVTGKVQEYTGTAVEQENGITGLVQVYYRGVRVVQEYTRAGVVQGHTNSKKYFLKYLLKYVHEKWYRGTEVVLCHYRGTGVVQWYCGNALVHC